MGKRKPTKGILFLAPSILGVAVLFLIPFLDVIRRSFFQSVGTKWVGLDNYATVLGNQAFQLASTNSALFTLVCIPLLIMLSFAIASFIHHQQHLKDLFKMGFLLPMALPIVVIALLWHLLFDYGGLLNGIIAAAGYTPLDWLNSPLAFWVMVGGYVWKNLGYSVILWLAALEGVPSVLYEAARIDGAGALTVFRRITLPVLAPAGFTITVLALINSFKVFREAYLVAGSYPHESMYTLQHLFNNWFVALSFDRISAASVMLSIVLFLLVLLLYRAWGAREAYGL